MEKLRKTINTGLALVIVVLAVMPNGLFGKADIEVQTPFSKRARLYG